MTNFSRCRLIKLGVNFLALTLMLWLSFVLVSTGLNYWFGDAYTFERYIDEPRRLLLDEYLDGFVQSLPFAACLAAVACAVQCWLHRRPARMMLVGGGLVLMCALVLTFSVPLSLINLLTFILVLAGFFLVFLLGGYWLRGRGS